MLGLPTVLVAQPSASDEAGFSFLRIEPSARAMSLGGAFVGVTNDVNAMFANPATLNEASARQFSLSMLNHLADVRFTTAAYGYDLKSIGTLAVGIRNVDYGTLSASDCTQVYTPDVCERIDYNPENTASAADRALTIGLSRAYNPKIRYGLNIHGIWSNIGDARARAIAADAGVVYNDQAHQFVVSAAVLNYGRTLKSLGTTEDQLPLDVRIGASKRLQYMPFTAHVMFYNLNTLAEKKGTDLGKALTSGDYLTLGGEFHLGTAMAIRLGYNPLRGNAFSSGKRLDLAGLGFGFGLQISRFRLDYGYNNWSSAGRLHQLSVQSKL